MRDWAAARAAVGSNGVFLPGVHSPPTIASISFHDTLSRGRAAGILLRIVRIDLRDVGKIDHGGRRETLRQHDGVVVGGESRLPTRATMIRPANTETAVGSVTSSSPHQRWKSRRTSSPLTRVAAIPTQSRSSRVGSGDHFPQRRLIVARETAAAADDDELPLRVPGKMDLDEPGEAFEKAGIDAVGRDEGAAEGDDGDGVLAWSLL